MVEEAEENHLPSAATIFYPKFSETITPYHTCLKILISSFYSLLMCLIITACKQYSPWSDTALCSI